MFGSKEASEDKLKKMVEKGKWDKLRKQYLDSDKTTQVALAKACAASRNDGSVNILTSLLEVDDVDVKIAAVTSLGLSRGRPGVCPQVRRLRRVGEKRMRIPRPTKRIVAPVCAILGILAAWQGACSAGLVPNFMLPSPVQVGQAP